MRVIVCQDLCIGCGVCCDICPEVFEMDGEMALPKTVIVPTIVEADCLEAMKACPVDAIAIE